MLSAALFAVGFLGVLVRRNTLVIYMCLELMLVAATLALVAFSRFNGTRGRRRVRLLHPDRGGRRGRRGPGDHRRAFPGPPDGPGGPARFPEALSPTDMTPLHTALCVLLAAAGLGGLDRAVPGQAGHGRRRGFRRGGRVRRARSARARVRRRPFRGRSEWFRFGAFACRARLQVRRSGGPDALHRGGRRPLRPRLLARLHARRPGEGPLFRGPLDLHVLDDRHRSCRQPVHDVHLLGAGRIQLLLPDQPLA